MLTANDTNLTKHLPQKANRASTAAPPESDEGTADSTDYISDHDVTTPPILKGTPPSINASRTDKNIIETVTFTLWVSKAGRVDRFELAEATDAEDYKRQLEESLPELLFIPAKQNGRAVNVVTTVSFTRKLKH